MTLYRHAQSKDELFAAVVAGACNLSEEAEQFDLDLLMKKPLDEILIFAGVECQKRFVHPNTIALMRVVIAASERFPHLGEVASNGFIGHWEEIIREVLVQKGVSKSLSETDLEKLSCSFVDGLFGTDSIRAWLGLGGASSEEQSLRAQRSTDTLINAINHHL